MAQANPQCNSGATSDNKAYLRRSEYLAWASPHCAKGRATSVYVNLNSRKRFNNQYIDSGEN